MSLHTYEYVDLRSLNRNRSLNCVPVNDMLSLFFMYSSA